MLLICHYEAKEAPAGATAGRMKDAIDVARLRWVSAVGDALLRIIHGPSFTANVRIFWDSTLGSAEELWENRGRMITEPILANVLPVSHKHWWIRLNPGVRWGWTFFGRWFAPAVDDVLTHEFGHVLGLPHSADPRSVMWRDGGGLAKHVHAVDAAAVTRIISQ